MIYQLAGQGMTMIRKLILGTASVLALGIGGATLDFSADADDLRHAVSGQVCGPGFRTMAKCRQLSRKMTSEGQK